MTQEETSKPEFRLEDLRPMASEGYAFETICDTAREDTVVIGIQQSWLQPLAENVYEVTLQSNRGLCQAILTVAQGKPGVVLWIPGAGENLNGPAGGVYAELTPEFQAADISSLRMGYRDPSSLEECALDVLMWLCFLTGVGAKQAVLVGNALGVTAAIPRLHCPPHGPGDGRDKLTGRGHRDNRQDSAQAHPYHARRARQAHPSRYGPRDLPVGPTSRRRWSSIPKARFP